MIEKPTGREFRVAVETWPEADLEIRSTETGMNFRGYAAVFNSWSEDLGGFREMIMPGAFARSLKRDRNIRMFLNHNSDILLASTKAGTLRLAEDEKGLAVDADLPDTTAGRDLAVLLARRDVDSMSFGFQVPDKASAGGPAQTWNADATERQLHELRLFEASPVTGWPAYTATSAAVRHLADIVGEEAEVIEEAVRVLFATTDQLTAEQRELFIRAINARSPSEPVIAAEIADYRARFAAKGLV